MEQTWAAESDGGETDAAGEHTHGHGKMFRSYRSGNRWGMQMYESWGGAWDNMVQGCKQHVMTQCMDERGVGQTYNVGRGMDNENWA